MLTPDDFLRLSEAGLTSKQIALVMEIMARDAKEAADKEEERKAKGRERWHRWNSKREPNVSKREQTLANDSCGGVTRGEDNLQTTEITGKEEKKVASPSARPSRGSRIPDDFCPDIEAAVSEGVPRLEAERQARSFCDYWRSKPGAGGLKLDWPATWRVWYRRNIPTVSKPQATAPPRKQTVGQQARDELKRMETLNNAPNNLPRYYDESDGEPGFAGTGIARRIAIAASR